MDWIIANKEWLFSGLLVGVPIALVGWLFARRRSRFSQNQKAGDGSVNIQVGGNIDLVKGSNDVKTEPKGRR